MKAKIHEVYIHFDPVNKYDKIWLARLEQKLEPLVNLELIKLWHRHKGLAGSHIEDEIITNIKTADAGLILLSQDYLNSKECQDIEAMLLDRYLSKQLKLFPLLLRPCAYHLGACYKAGIDPLPDPDSPLALASSPNSVLTNIVRTIRSSMGL